MANNQMPEMLKSATQTWNKNVVSHARTILFYRIIIVTLSVIVLILFSQNSRLSRQRKLIPYVITLNAETGRADFTGVIQASETIVLTGNIIQYHLSQFITNIRTISSDNIVIRSNLSEALRFSSDTTRLKIANFIDEDETFAKVTLGIRRDIRFRQFSQTGETAWTVEWEETIRQNGNIINVELLSGRFFITQRDSQTIQQAQNNPLGFYVDDFNITPIQEF